MSKVSYYLVGGAVRDELLGLPIKDKDFVVVGQTVEQMIADGYLPVGRDFPVFLHPRTKEEYALARTERKTGQGHQGFTFHANAAVTLEEDLKRRDLTINAIAKTLEGELIDPFNGMLDLENKLLRHVSEAFVEDPLRVFRVCRFNSTLNFDIHPDTLNLMKQVVNSGEIKHLSQERIWNEIVSGLKGGNPSKMIDSLRTCGALREMSDMLLLGAEDIKDRKLIYRALDLASKNQLAIESRVAIFCLLTEKNLTKVLKGNTQPAPNFHVSRLKAVLNKLKASKAQHQVSLHFLTHLRSVLNAYQMKNEQLVDLIINLDGLRNPIRFGHILESISIVDEVFTNGAHSGQLILVKDSLKVLKSTNHGDLKLTKDPESIRKVVRRQRIAALDDAFPSRAQFDETVVSEPNE